MHFIFIMLVVGLRVEFDIYIILTSAREHAHWFHLRSFSPEISHKRWFRKQMSIGAHVTNKHFNWVMKNRLNVIVVIWYVCVCERAPVNSMKWYLLLTIFHSIVSHTKWWEIYACLSCKRTQQTHHTYIVILSRLNWRIYELNLYFC